jgi:DNA (cytosine-5)-methyltransferase 1
MAKKPTVISLFAGAGGMDLGFQQAGFDIIWANEYEEIFAETYKKNIGNHVVVGDIQSIQNKDIPKEADVVIGGFPCQGFSIANPNRKSAGMRDKRNFLYREMLRVIKHSQPKYFIAENVKGILNIEKGQVIPLIIQDFKELGYHVDYKLLNAANYGVPQQRERVIIMGNRVDKQNYYPDQTHADLTKVQNGQVNLAFEEKHFHPHVTAKEVIGHLDNVWISNNPQEVDGKTIHNHIASTNVHDKFWARKHRPKQADICDYLKEWRSIAGISTQKVDKIFGYAHTAGHWFRKDNKSGSIPKPDDWWKLKEILGFDDKYDAAVTELELREIAFEQSLRITNWDRPSDTITATGPEIHVNRKRRLSIRECAILQTFPDDFIFAGSLNSMQKQIGNAVPVLLAKIIAEKIKGQL